MCEYMNVGIRETGCVRKYVLGRMCEWACECEYAPVSTRQTVWVCVRTCVYARLCEPGCVWKVRVKCEPVSVRVDV